MKIVIPESLVNEINDIANFTSSGKARGLQPLKESVIKQMVAIVSQHNTSPPITAPINEDSFFKDYYATKKPQTVWTAQIKTEPFSLPSGFEWVECKSKINQHSFGVDRKPNGTINIGEQYWAVVDSNGEWVKNSAHKME